jgi:hypothetical protein
VSDVNALLGRQQSSQHEVSTRTEEETPSDNSYAFGQDNLRYESRSLDEDNSHQGRNNYIRPAVSSAYPSTAENTYGSGLPTPFGVGGGAPINLLQQRAISRSPPTTLSAERSWPPVTFSTV